MIGPLAFAGLSALATLCGIGLARVYPDARERIALDVFLVVGVPLLVFFLAPGPVGGVVAGWSFVLITGLTALALIDGKTKTVPDLLTIPMILLGLAHAATQPGLFPVFAITSLIVVAAGLVTGWILRGRDSWIGGGDVLLFAGAMAWFGPALAPDILLIVGISYALWYAATLVVHMFDPKRQRSTAKEVPLAPILGLAQLILWTGGPIF